MEGGFVTFSQRLRSARLERFWSQADLATRAGVSKLTISRLETGDRAPSLRTVRALADALGIEPGQLARTDEVAEQKKAAA
jgi:transcriptional regulator with XRE-family HTH domain